MGFDSKTLPDSLKRCIPQAERAKQVELLTSDESAEKQAIREERDMHDTFANWCRVNSLSFIHARMDRKSTIREGFPDFAVLHQGKVCCIEFKFGQIKLRPEQSEVITELMARGTPVLVSDSVLLAIQWTKERLGL